MTTNKETAERLIHEWIATMTECVLQPSGRLTAIKATIENALNAKDLELTTAKQELARAMIEAAKAEHLEDPVEGNSGDAAYDLAIRDAINALKAVAKAHGIEVD